MTELIQTKASKLRGNSQVEAVEFVSYKPKKREGTPRKEEDTTADINEFNMKRVKHEVFKFGMSGFDSQKKEEAKMKLAISLGAKPPKNKYKNYKLILEEKRKERQEKEKEEKDMIDHKKRSVLSSKGKARRSDVVRKKKKGPGGLLDVYGKVNKVPLAKS